MYCRTFLQIRRSRGITRDSETDTGAISESKKNESKLNYYTGTTRDILEDAKNGMRLRCIIENLFPKRALALQWAQLSVDESAAKILGRRAKSSIERWCFVYNEF